MPLSCYVPSQIIPKSRVVHLADKQILKRHILNYPKMIVSKNPRRGWGWGGFNTWPMDYITVVSDQYHCGSRGQHWQQGPAPLWVQRAALAARSSTIVGPGGSTGSQGPTPLWVQGAALAARSSTIMGPGGSTGSQGPAPLWVQGADIADNSYFLCTPQRKTM